MKSEEDAANQEDTEDQEDAVDVHKRSEESHSKGALCGARKHLVIDGQTNSVPSTVKNELHVCD